MKTWIKIAIVVSIIAFSLMAIWLFIGRVDLSILSGIAGIICQNVQMQISNNTELTTLEPIEETTTSSNCGGLLSYLIENKTKEEAEDILGMTIPEYCDLVFNEIEEEKLKIE